MKANKITTAFRWLAEKDNYTKREAEWQLNDLKANINYLIMLVLYVLTTFIITNIIANTIIILIGIVLIIINNKFFKKVRNQLLDTFYWIDDNDNSVEGFINAFDELFKDVELNE